MAAPKARASREGCGCEEMRDPTRIPALLHALEKAWVKHPDLRLGQLIVNVADQRDPFYMEDGELLTRLIFYPDKEKAVDVRNG